MLQGNFRSAGLVQPVPVCLQRAGAGFDDGAGDGVDGVAVVLGAVGEIQLIIGGAVPFAEFGCGKGDVGGREAGGVQRRMLGGIQPDVAGFAGFGGSGAAGQNSGQRQGCDCNGKQSFHAVHTFLSVMVIVYRGKMKRTLKAEGISEEKNAAAFGVLPQGRHQKPVQSKGALRRTNGFAEGSLFAS